MNEDSKKPPKYYILVFALIIFIGLITATYAFFQIDVDNNTTNTTITANTECFDITFEDISEAGVNNLDINYPITDEYALGQTDNNDNIKPVVVKVSNKCTQVQDNLNYKLAITTLAKDTGYISDNKVRYNVDKALNSANKNNLKGPDYLSKLTKIEDTNTLSLLNETITKKNININNYDVVNTYIIDSDSLASNNTRTYYIKLWIDYYEGDSAAYTNPESHTDENELNNSTKGQKFESVISLIADGTTSKSPISTINILREKDKEVSEGVEHLSSLPDQGGMYRYQGTDNVPNWICFGTRDANTCKTEAGIDKYMYRIIGITEEGQLYLIKETVLKEGNTSEFVWNEKYTIEDCAADNCDWSNADLYKRINGTSSNGNPIFVDSSEYEYMAQGTEWYNLIDGEHEWMYGDLIDEIYNGAEIYAAETGKTSTTRYWLDEGQETCSDENPCTLKDYTWNNNVNAKISLMYIHDLIYAYYDGSNEASRGNPESAANVANSWIHFQKDGYNASATYEWLISRFGLGVEGSHSIYAWSSENDGDLHAGHLYKAFTIRPVFYLESSAQIASGDGTKNSPFILS